MSETYSALDIITSALFSLKIYGPGDPLGDADTELVFARLNDMLDDWADDFIFLYTINQISADLVSGTASYTVGNNGVIASPRPARVVYGPGRASVTVSSTTTPVDVVSALEFYSLQGINSGTGTPNTIYYDPQYPSGIVKVAPTPNAAATLNFAAWFAFPGFADLTTEYTFSPGTADAMKFNLPIAIKPDFTNAQLDQDIALVAMRTKDSLRYTNRTSRAMMTRGREATK